MAAKQEWLVIAPDYPGALDKRMKVRQQHFAELMSKGGGNYWTLGGATLDEPVKDGESLKINGSVMMAAANSPEEIMERLKNDVYAKEVWDLEKVQIIPVKMAIRKPL